MLSSAARVSVDPRAALDKVDVNSSYEQSSNGGGACFRRKLKFVLAILITLVQALWAVVIPIKNVIIMPYPKLIADGDMLANSADQYANESLLVVNQTIPGKVAYQIAKDVVNLAINKTELRQYFMRQGDFAFDEIGGLLTPEQHHIFAKYYSLVFQASEMLAMGTIKRTQQVYMQHTKKDNPIATITCSRHEVIQGMVCTNKQGDMCDDGDWGDWVHEDTYHVAKLMPVDLMTLTKGTGWQNKVSLMGFVSSVNNGMRTLFQKQDYYQAWWEVRPSTSWVTDNPKILNYTGWGYPILRSTLWDSRWPYDWVNDNYTKFESCMGSEDILSSFYSKLFATRLIEDAVITNQVFGARPLINVSLPYDDVWEDMFRHDILITTGAGAQAFEDDQRNFMRTSMTRSTTSVGNLKLDRPMSGTMVMGNAPRQLEYFGYYADWFYSYLNTTVEGDTVVADWRQLGAYYAGFNGFKFDFTHNTMGVYRLAERRKSEGTGYNSDWFEQEKAIAMWYRQHELSDPNSLVTLAKSIWGDDSPHETEHFHCIEALYRKIAQVVWIMALKKQPVMSHLVFQSMVDPDPPATWFFKQMTVTEVVGENVGGFRVFFPFARTDGNADTGAAWPLIPLLNAFRLEFGADSLLVSLMAEMNTTFLSLIGVEGGKLMMPDGVHCNFGWSTLGLSGLDDKTSAWNKWYPLMEAMINATINQVDRIHQQLNHEVIPVVIPRGYTNYSKKSNMGPPVYWTHQPLGVGLMKLSAKLSPKDDEVQPLRNALVCYNTLETRFLNISTRCWAEPDSIRQTREKTTSEGLRMVKFSMWSLGVVLNILGAVVAVRYFLKIFTLWKLCRFSDLGLKLALNMDIQGIGMLSLDGIVIMAFSSLPLILCYHLPQDLKFIEGEKSTQDPIFAECMVLLSLTWFVRLGIELAVQVINLRYYNWWFNTLTSRIRLATIGLILMIRMWFKTDGINYNQGLTKLIGSCVISMGLGFLSVIISVLFDQENEHSRDTLSRLMSQNQLPRNIYGALAQLREGWTHAGMMLEGWKVLRVNGRTNMLIFGAQKLVEPVGSSDRAVLTTLTPELFKRIETASHGAVAPSSEEKGDKVVEDIRSVEPTR